MHNIGFMVGAAMFLAAGLMAVIKCSKRSRE